MRRHPLHPRMEFLPRAELQVLQARKLRALLARATARDGYYRRLLSDADVTPESIRTTDDVRRIPFSTKAAFLDDQAAAPPFGTRLLVDEPEIARIATSGGSSGGRKEIVAHTRQDLLVLGGLQATPFRWGGLSSGDVFLFHAPLTNSTASLAFPLGIEAVARIKYLIGHAGFAERVELLLEHGADGMQGSPSAINGFTEELLRRGIVPRERFPDFKVIVLAAENFALAWAQRISEAWGATIIEGYGATQTHGGYCLCSCERGLLHDTDRGMLHGLEWSFLLEVVDPETGEPVAPGDHGELIVTTLDKRASPTIRYRTGDRVLLLDGPCSCGRETMLVESGTIGRYDDMVKVKGNNIWPDQADEVLFAIPGLREYQATVVIGDRGRDELELRFAADDGIDPATLSETVVDRFKAGFGVTVRPIPTPHDALEIRWAEGGKARRWPDRRTEMLAG